MGLMLEGDYMMGIGGMLLMWLLWILIIALVVWGIYRLVKRSRSASSVRCDTAERESPLDILKRRYAAGDMSTDEYEERSRKLDER